ncbi:Uncharacterized protein Fot_38255 [Forsythia ovata]|uniref:Uncharacterized protein n=1 Tax=Forsythia ovata TaxID=205694 RepID=A0ABD1S3N8_9LAMI
MSKKFENQTTKTFRTLDGVRVVASTISTLNSPLMDYDAATREFYSSVAKRTRSKRKIYFGVAHRNSYSSGDVEEINTDHGLDETFAPNACRKGKKTVRQSQGNSSSCKNVEDKLGNRNEDVNSKDIVIEKIDKAEFRNKRMHSASEKGSSIRQQLRGDSAANLLILAV